MRFLQGADKAARLAHREIYIPKNARLVPGPSGCAVYAYDCDRRGVSVFAAMGFRGTAGKPEFHYIYRTEAARTLAIEEFWKSVISSREFRAKRQAEKSAWTNPLKVGDLMYTSWGYDQTNTEFYAVTRVSGKRVWIREIAGDYDATGFMSGRSWPAMPIRFVGEETMHIARQSGEGASVKIGHHYAYQDQGRTHYTSSYA